MRRGRKKRRKGGGSGIYRSIYRNRKRFIRLIIIVLPSIHDRCPLYLTLAKHWNPSQRWNLLDGWSFPIVLLHFYPRGDINFILSSHLRRKEERKKKEKERKKKIKFHPCHVANKYFIIFFYYNSAISLRRGKPGTKKGYVD